ncbi:hypothetical protein LTR09_001259 [Extremus antarcticus]|uniref:Ankyrin repeat protein n=1 Tax=Extremus antarcticus TaxID=702011 RepID=A0AAJ0GIF5_9PEZI|nr:hypothetical protein LTR09_001259 [Extremus antarcticus]
MAWSRVRSTPVRAPGQLSETVSQPRSSQNAHAGVGIFANFTFEAASDTPSPAPELMMSHSMNNETSERARETEMPDARRVRRSEAKVDELTSMIQKIQLDDCSNNGDSDSDRREVAPHQEVLHLGPDTQSKATLAAKDIAGATLSVPADVKYGTKMGTDSANEDFKSVDDLLEDMYWSDHCRYLHWRMLGEALAAGQCRFVRKLVSEHSNTPETAAWDSSDELGRVLLHLLAEDGNDAGIKLLVERGADVNAADKHGKTPLMYAAFATKLCTVEALLSSGADVNLEDLSGRRVLHYAAYGALLSSDGLVHHEDLENQGALHYAAYRCKGERYVSKRYGGMSRCRKVADRCIRGQTDAEHYGISRCREVVQALLNSGARTAVTDQEGKTPYDIARLSDDHVLTERMAPWKPEDCKQMSATESTMKLLEARRPGTTYR